MITEFLAEGIFRRFVTRQGTFSRLRWGESASNHAPRGRCRASLGPLGCGARKKVQLRYQQNGLCGHNQGAAILEREGVIGGRRCPARRGSKVSEPEPETFLRRDGVHVLSYGSW